ncbi:hypothetical protein B0H17DRAFT_1138096 [Mycena rosella]|uniref:Uncharacterized protein n=1 Tax=Mycena rosella TaxID=1033263 RepID=A0AAD7GCK1_MYCRO|nr:hypothetical protein B0H17DRAFT_1138096 [Mycena rosella]
MQPDQLKWTMFVPVDGKRNWMPIKQDSERDSRQNIGVLVESTGRRELAELRDKAGKAKDASVTKFQDTKDRHSSKNANPPPPPRPSKFSRPPPPGPSFLPPPQRGGSTGAASASSPSPAASPGPPPIVRATRPALPAAASPSPPPPPPVRAPVSRFRNEPADDQPAPPPPPARKFRGGAEETQLDWGNLSPEDKEVFFGWLDEFFSRYLNKPIPTS